MHSQSQRLLPSLLVLFLSVAASRCGAGPHNIQIAPPPPPSISIEEPGPSTPLNTGGTRKFVALEDDMTPVSVNWSVVQPNGGTIASDGTYTAPALPGTFTIMAVLQSNPTSTAQAAIPVVIPVGHLATYEVGVDYHATGTDFQHSDFITTYQQPEIRQAVLAQLQGMADRGANFISTGIWFVTEPGTSNQGETWRATFPMSDQEAANLKTYAQDVASIVGSGGNQLRLDIVMFWLGAADYTIGNVTDGLGYTPISAATFTSRVEATTDSLIAAVSGIQRVDKVPVVDTIYMDAEVMIGAKANEDWFLMTHYPRFVSKVSTAGFTPAVYYIIDGDEAHILDDGYVDSDFPALNGHRSMYWVYRSMNFMVQQQLPLPARIDFSCYLNSTATSYPTLLHRVLGDADAIMPSLGAPKVYGAAETYYFADPSQRHNLGQAFAGEAAQNARFRHVAFWTTPDGGGTGINNAYPFGFEDFYPPPE